MSAYPPSGAKRTFPNRCFVPQADKCTAAKVLYRQSQRLQERPYAELKHLLRYEGYETSTQKPAHGGNTARQISLASRWRIVQKARSDQPPECRGAKHHRGADKIDPGNLILAMLSHVVANDEATIRPANKNWPLQPQLFLTGPSRASLCSAEAQIVRKLAAPLQYGQAACLTRLQATSTRDVRARLRRVAGCATSTGFASHAGATANLKLTFHPDHSAGANQ